MARAALLLLCCVLISTSTLGMERRGFKDEEARLQASLLSGDLDEEEEDDAEKPCVQELMDTVLGLVESEKASNTRDNGCFDFQMKAAHFAEGNRICLDLSKRNQPDYSLKCYVPPYCSTGDHFEYRKSAPGSALVLESIFRRFETADSKHVFATVDAEAESGKVRDNHSFAIFKQGALYFIVSAYNVAFFPDEWWTGTFPEKCRLGSFWSALGKTPADGLDGAEFRAWLTSMAGDTAHPGSSPADYLWITGSANPFVRSTMNNFHGSQLNFYMVDLPKNGGCFATRPADIVKVKPKAAPQPQVEPKKKDTGLGFHPFRWAKNLLKKKGLNP